MQDLGAGYRQALGHAMSCKETGNKLLSSKQSAEALEKYQEGITRIQHLHTFVMGPQMKVQLEQLRVDLNNNAAHVSLQLEQYQRAAEHATAVLEERKDNFKARYRRGNAWLEIGKLNEAKKDLDLALAASPRSAQVKKALRKWQDLTDRENQPAGFKQEEDEANVLD